MKWLVADEVAREMRAKLSAGLASSPDVQAAFAAAVGDYESAARSPRNLQVAGDVAQIQVEGLLTERPDFIAWLMGYANTTYQSIQQALAMADADPSVKRIELRVNSPGGTVAGLFETLGALDDTAKPVSVLTSFAASAAYAIAARGGRIMATTGATEVGSIGVASSFWALDEVVDIASTDAPKKRPDVRTEEGKAMVREELDAVHDIFVDAIAKGRGTTKANVNANFGQGGLLTAVEAKKRGMVDRIQRAALKAVPRASAESSSTPDATAGESPAGQAAAGSSAAPTTNAAPAPDGGAAKPKGRKMDLQTLKNDHPELYAAIKEEGRKEGFAAGQAEGLKQERDRVSAHLVRGQACGALDLALECVENGSEMTETLKAKYDTAGRKRDDQAARVADNQVAEAALTGAAPANETPDAGDQVASILEKSMGL